jgi:hypothetical protein
VSAALHWVLWAYIFFYAFIGLFVVALLAAGLLGRCWSTIVDCWARVPGRFTDALSLQPAPVRTRR